MRIPGSILALSLAALCVAPAMHAATPPAGTLSCYIGGVAAQTINLNSFYFDTFESQYFTVYTDVADFDDLAFKRFFTSQYDYCQFSASTRTYPSVVTEEGVAVSAGMGGTYTQVTFSYKELTGSSGSSIKMPESVPQTREEKAKSLAAFLARVPSPAATQK
jgi:hypothetical protein